MQIIKVSTKKVVRIEQDTSDINVLIIALTAMVANDPSNTVAQDLLTAYQGI
jgi:hypothetical protein